jgi:hypothetical protein
MAEPHPKVLNRTSLMTCVSGSTLIWSRITSPHCWYRHVNGYSANWKLGMSHTAGAPTNPSPTELSDLSNVPTFRGRE